MRKRLNKFLSTLVSGALCVSFVPLVAIASVEGIEPTNDTAIVETGDESNIDDPNAGISLTSDLEGDPVEGEEPVTPEPAETPEVPEVVEPETPQTPEVVEAEEDTDEFASPENSTEEAVGLEDETDEAEEFKEGVVATVGDEKFATLQEAVDFQSRARALVMPTILQQNTTESIVISRNTNILLNGYTLTGNGASAITCATSNLTITINGAPFNSDQEGNGAIQAADGYRAITVATTGDAGGTLNLNNVTLMGNGSGIGNEPTVTVTLGSMGKKTYQVGGLVYVQNTKVNATSCKFLNGIAASGYGDSSSGLGGAIAMAPSKDGATKAKCSLNFNDCIFNNNKADQGAAVSLKAFTSATANSRIPVTFTGCTVSESAIAPAVQIDLSYNSDKSPLDLRIENKSEFKDNQAGALSVACNDSIANIASSIFSGNARPKVGSSAYGGAAINFGGSSTQCKATITDCRFLSNASYGNGGAIAISGCSAPLIEKCTFGGEDLGNFSNGSGGAVSIASAPEAVIDNCTFLDNAAKSNGGAIYVSYSSSVTTTLEIRDSALTANATTDGNGGAVYTEVPTTVTGSFFEGNKAIYRGGAFYANSSLLSIGETTITGNIADLKNTALNNKTTAGGIHFVPRANGAVLEALNGEVHIYENSNPNEYSQLMISGRGVSSEIFVEDTTSKATTVKGFEGLESTNESGGTYVLTKYPSDKFTTDAAKCYQRFYSVAPKSVEVYLDPGHNCKSHHAESDTLVVCTTLQEAYDQASKSLNKQITICSPVTVDSDDNRCFHPDGFTMKYARCSENQSGVMLNIMGNIQMENVLVDGTNVTASAAMINISNSGQLTVQAGTTIQNATKGAISNRGGTLKIEGGSICNNSSTGFGGAIYSTGDDKKSGSITITAGSMSNNRAVGSGGAIFCDYGQLVMTGGEITSNTSTSQEGAENSHSTGGGICIGTKGALELSGGDISRNETTGDLGYGGGIALGATYACSEMKMTMTDGAIHDNTAKGNGGGLAVWTGGEASLYGGDIYGNICNYRTSNWGQSYYGGGGLYVNKNASLHLENVEITRNDAFAGSAIAACPTSDMRLYIKNGAVIHDNRRDTNADTDILIMTLDNRGIQNPVAYSIPKYTASGHRNVWVKSANGDLATTRDLNGVLEPTRSISFSNKLTGEAARQAAANCSLKIYENYSNGSTKDARLLGGAIGCNGTLTIGEADTNFVIEKKVSGTVKPLENEFEFDVQFTQGEESLAYAYASISYIKGTFTKTSNNNGSQGDVQHLAGSTDGRGVLRVNLKANEYLIFKGLPSHIRYSVIENTLSSNASFDHSIVDWSADPKNNGGYKYSTASGGYEWFIKDDGLFNSNNKDTDGALKDFYGELVNGYCEIIVTNEYLLGQLTIDKTLRKQSDSADTGVYKDNAGNGTSTAVFHVEGYWGDEKFYDNFVSLNFEEEGSQSITLDDMLVGASYVITEVQFDGSGYVTTGNYDQITIVLGKDSSEVDRTVKFENTLDDKETPNQGVINRYKFEAGEKEASEKTWEQIGLKQNQAA